VNNVHMTFGKDARKLDSGKKVVEGFRKNGYEPEGYTLYAYASLQAVADAMNATKSFDGEKISKWLKSNSVLTVMGEKAWDTKGDLKVSDYVMYKWDAKGEYSEIR
jgi:branched-chain amino acid transport system substrate-binding protein